jgi:hypothetical protein
MKKATTSQSYSVQYPDSRIYIFATTYLLYTKNSSDGPKVGNWERVGS